MVSDICYVFRRGQQGKQGAKLLVRNGNKRTYDRISIREKVRGDKGKNSTRSRRKKSGENTDKSRRNNKGQG